MLHRRLPDITEPALRTSPAPHRARLSYIGDLHMKENSAKGGHELTMRISEQMAEVPSETVIFVAGRDGTRRGPNRNGRIR